MIAILDTSSTPQLIKNGGVIEAKIIANFLSYGVKYPFLTFWQGYNNNLPTSIICKFEDTVFLSASDSADFSELKNFLLTIGFSQLQAESEILKKLKIGYFEEFICFEYNDDSVNAADEICKVPKLEDVYKLMFSTQEKNICPVNFEGWYADLSHRIRHKTAIAHTFENKGAAVVSHITESSAIIGGIAVLPEFRRQGIASKLLNSLKAEVLGRSIFAITDDLTAQFYIENGFVPVDKIGIFLENNNA